MKVKNKFFLLIFCSTICIYLFSGCNQKGALDSKYISEFHYKYSEMPSESIISNDLALFVDYSTCITLGQHSSFFQMLIPSFVSAAKHYYSIKGPNIQEEHNVDIYNELKNIVEVNYADLAKAANMIADGNSEAVLLTDGEYYQNNIAGGSINYPYMAPALKKWLLKGGDIYIIAEPYVELYKKNSYQKKRFYILFTDSRLESNIYNRIMETVDFSNYPQVTSFHLSASHPTISNRMNINTNLSATSKRLDGYEIQDWSISWEAIENIIVGGVDPQTGKALPHGELVMGNLALDKNSYGGYEISDIAIDVYDINQAYNCFYNMKENLDSIEIESISSCQYAFVFDTTKFENEGIIDLYFDRNMWSPYNFLTNTPYNYTRIDIRISSIKNIFNQYADVFKFDAIGQPGMQNVSITESVKQCLYDPEIKKMMISSPLYSIYIKSNKY